MEINKFSNVKDNEWINYGDVNFEEYGGVLLRKNETGDIDFVWASEGYDENGNEAMFASYGMLFADDLKERAETDKLVRDALFDEGINPSVARLDEIAFAYIQTYGAIQVGGGALHGHNPYPSTYDDLILTPKQLHKELINVGYITDVPKNVERE